MVGVAGSDAHPRDDFRTFLEEFVVAVQQVGELVLVFEKARKYDAQLDSTFKKRA